MKKRHPVCRLLSGRSGEGYIEAAVGVFVALLLVVFSLNVFRLYVLQSDLDLYVKQVVETACSAGSTGQAASDKQAELQEQLGIEPDGSFSGTVYWVEGYPAVQYGETVRFTAELHTELQGFGLLSFPVTLRASASGLSRRYWK
ncbi:MAG: DUF4320 family protein [Clostridia bacterium]|jgi:hypothetical protein|nr:DUF4320 family protein [Clostridia bacterium]